MSGRQLTMRVAIVMLLYSVFLNDLKHLSAVVLAMHLVLARINRYLNLLQFLIKNHGILSKCDEGFCSKESESLNSCKHHFIAIFNLC